MLTERLTAISAEPGSLTIGLAALGTRRFEPGAAIIAKRGVERILGVTMRANHNGLHSDLDIDRVNIESK